MRRIDLFLNVIFLAIAFSSSLLMLINFNTFQLAAFFKFSVSFAIIRLSFRYFMLCWRIGLRRGPRALHVAFPLLSMLLLTQSIFGRFSLIPHWSNAHFVPHTLVRHHLFFHTWCSARIRSRTITVGCLHFWYTHHLFLSQRLVSFLRRWYRSLRSLYHIWIDR